MINFNLNNALIDIANILTSVFDLVIDIFNFIFYWVFCLIGSLADMVQALFRAFCGLGNSAILAGNPTDDVYFMFMSPQVINVLISMGVLALLLLIITTAIAVVKTEFVGFSEKGGNSKSKVVGTSLKALANIIVVPLCCIFAVVGVNAILRAVDSITSGGTQTSLSRQVFVSTAYDGNKCRYTGEDEPTCSTSNYAALLRAGVNTFGLKFDNYVNISGGSNGETLAEEYAYVIDYLFLNNIEFSDKYIKDMQSNPELLGIYKDILTEKQLETLVNGEQLGGYTYIVAPQGASFGLSESKIKNATSFDYTNKGLVRVFYDLKEFNIVIGLLAIIMVAFNLFTMILTIIKRMFELVILFVVSPPIVAITPIDGGNALKQWRQTFVSSLLSLFGPIIAINLIFIILPLVYNIDFLGSSGLKAAITFQGKGLKGLESLSKILITCAAVSYVKDLSGTLAKILGSYNAADTKGAVEDFGKKVRAARNIGRTMGAAAMAPARAIGGGILSRARGDGFGEGFRNSLLSSADNVLEHGIGVINETAGSKINARNRATNAVDNMKARVYRTAAFSSAAFAGGRGVGELEARAEAHENAVTNRGLSREQRALNSITEALNGGGGGYQSRNGRIVRDAAGNRRNNPRRAGIDANLAATRADVAQMSENSNAQTRDIHQMRQTLGHESDFDPGAFNPDGTLRRSYNGPGSNTILGQSGRTAGRAEDSIREQRRHGRVMNEMRNEQQTQTATLDNIQNSAENIDNNTRP